MVRVNVINEYGDLEGWFDISKAERFDEDVYWDGRNQISVATGTQTEHETLYRTAKGRWVLHHWSQWQGKRDWYQYISDAQAYKWLLKNGHDEAVRRYFGEIEEERGPGRPEIGPAVHVRLPEELLAKIDEQAQKEGVTRAEKIRRLLSAALRIPS